VPTQKSTIVRIIKGGMRLGSAVLPGPTSALAERMWCTIPRGKPAPAREPGGVTMLDHAVAAEAWGEGPAVYFLHGWGGRRGQFDAFVEPLVHKGYRVVALDAPGHGDSGPGAFGAGRGLLTEFCDALAAAIARFGPAHAVVGHSLGGLAIAVALLDGLPAERAVMIAPAPDTPAYTVDFARRFGFSEGVRRRFMRRIERRVGRPMADFDVLARARETEVTPLPRLLVVHDRADREVAFEDGRALAAAWPQADFVATEGLGHRRILRDPQVIQVVVDHMAADRQAEGRPRCVRPRWTPPNAHDAGLIGLPLVQP
jgi:pimeloyl-ACP methyl ester carboxylesterase